MVFSFAHFNQNVPERQGDTEVRKQGVCPENYHQFEPRKIGRNEFCPLSLLKGDPRASDSGGTKPLPTPQTPRRRDPVQPNFWEWNIFGSPPDIFDWRRQKQATPFDPSDILATV